MSSYRHQLRPAACLGREEEKEEVGGEERMEEGMERERKANLNSLLTGG